MLSKVLASGYGHVLATLDAGRFPLAPLGLLLVLIVLRAAFDRRSR